MAVRGFCELNRVILCFCPSSRKFDVYTIFGDIECYCRCISNGRRTYGVEVVSPLKLYAESQVEIYLRVKPDESRVLSLLSMRIPISNDRLCRKSTAMGVWSWLRLIGWGTSDMAHDLDQSASQWLCP